MHPRQHLVTGTSTTSTGEGTDQIPAPRVPGVPMIRRIILPVLSVVFCASVAIVVGAQNNWVYFGQDQGASKYSTLTQINTGNVKNLKRAWTFHTGDKSGFFESTPLVIDSVMYFSAQNGFYAIDAVTGRQVWKFD